MITCYSNSDRCGDKTDIRSTTGYFFKVFDALVSWCLRKQPIIALSSYVAEYITKFYATWQAILIESTLKELNI